MEPNVVNVVQLNVPYRAKSLTRLIMHQEIHIPMTLNPFPELKIIPSSLIPNRLLEHMVSGLAISYRSVLINVG
jgi:hypothetical protein